MPKRKDWASVRDGAVWATPEGDQIRKVNPRGKVLYYRHDNGERRGVWYDSLREAKAGRADVTP